MQQDEIIFDGTEITHAFRRQLRVWVWVGPLLLGLLLLLALCLVPRSYTASVSIAIQQPSAGGSALALLTGGGSSPSKRYIGVLKSRELAEIVERRVHLQDLYGGPRGRFHTEQGAAEFLMKSVKPEDSATDGLLYVGVTLPGPPKLSFSRKPSETQIEEAAALAANFYALALKRYYIANDTDQSSVLLRQADQELRQARTGYDEARDRVLEFSNGLNRVDPRSAPGLSLPSDGGSDADSGSSDADSGSDVGGSSDAGNGSEPGLAGTAAQAGEAAASVAGLGGLYSQLNRVQTDLRAAKAVRQAGDQRTEEQLRSLPSVPTDDPLLASIRSQVKQDQLEYNFASSLYADENPRVVSARKRLDIDQAELARQIQGVKSRQTTSSIHSDLNILALYNRQKSLLAQIAQTNRRLKTHRQLSGELGSLQTEVMLRLKVLETAMVEAKKIKLNNASALSRMSVVDTAIPPKSGEPGATKLAAACLALVLLAFGVAVVREYLRRAGGTPPESGVPMHSINGTGNGVGPAPLEEPADAVPSRPREH